jgi:hypothetical protein
MEPATTKALDFWQARKQGLRLPEPELRCLCGELSDDPVCGRCLEHQLQSETKQ